MQSVRWASAAERVCLAVLLLWLVWLPLPFGSVIPRARLPLIVVPLLVCAAAALIRFYATRSRNAGAQPTRPMIIWTNGMLLFLAIAALQLVPVPLPLLDLLSPESSALWRTSVRIAHLAGVPARSWFPITVDPRATAVELFRLASLFAAFTASALMIRSPERRVALASVLCGIGAFEALYGLREAALQRYEIWGWVNRLIFNRVTGTFVNPNHFAHYLAIIVPMAFFLIASKWHVSGTTEMPVSLRFMNLLEHGVITVGYALLTGASCLAGILLGQSRGALLALCTGLLAVASMLPGRRLVRLGLASAAGIALLVSLVVFLGKERTVARFVPNKLEQETLVGRRVGIAAAAGVWRRFPAFGSGVGTFERVVSMDQTRDLEKVYDHAHNDYAEIAATAGAIGFLVALVSLLVGYVLLVRLTFGDEATTFSWRRRAFQAAALASIAIAGVHAMFDFNFFIPSNPATLAVIAGAAVATVDYDKRTRR